MLGLQCARQIKDAHREVKELVATETARNGASLPEDLPAVTGTGLPGSEELCQEHSSTAEEPSPADGSSSPSGNDAHTGGDSNAHAGDSSTAAAAKTASEQLHSAGGALGADSMGTHGRQAHASEEEGSRGGFEEYETDELSPLEREVAVAAETVIYSTGLSLEKLLQNFIPKYHKWQWSLTWLDVARAGSLNAAACVL